MKRTDWELVQTVVDDHRTPEQAGDMVINKEYINTEIDTWYTTAERAVDEVIPHKSTLFNPTH